MTSPLVDPAAHALTAFRALADSRGRQYTATTFPKDPRKGCEYMVRMGLALSYLTEFEVNGESYAMLDVLDEGGDIIQDFAIPTKAAFRWWYQKLNLRVESTDGDD